MAEMVDAVEVLSSTMRDTEAAPQHRITAARSILDYGVKLTELTDLAARVEALEAEGHASVTSDSQCLHWQSEASAEDAKKYNEKEQARRRLEQCRGLMSPAV